MELFELLSQQAASAKNARRAWRRLVFIWLLNRGLIVLGIVAAFALAAGAAKYARDMVGLAGGVLLALLILSGAAFLARTLRGSAFVAAFRAREQAGRLKVARRKATLRTVTEQLNAKSIRENPEA